MTPELLVASNTPSKLIDVPLVIAMSSRLEPLQSN